MGKKNNNVATAKPTVATSRPSKSATRVEVICEGHLGRKLLRKGDVTDDPAYVGLLNDPRNLVRAVNSMQPEKPITLNDPTGETMSEVKQEVETTNSTTTTTELPPAPEVEVEKTTKVKTETSHTE